MPKPRLEVISLLLTADLRSRLRAAGFRTVEDLEGCTQDQIANGMTGLDRFITLRTPEPCSTPCHTILTDARLDLSEASEVLRAIKNQEGQSNCPAFPCSPDCCLERLTSHSLSGDDTHHEGTAATALELMKAKIPPIVCFCRDLDQALGGGVFPGRVSESDIQAVLEALTHGLIVSCILCVMDMYMHDR